MRTYLACTLWHILTKLLNDRFMSDFGKIKSDAWLKVIPQLMARCALQLSPRWQD